MGRIVFAAAMSHVLDPDYYERVCGAVGRRKTDEAMAAIAAMGERFSATGASHDSARSNPAAVPCSRIALASASCSG